MYSCICAKFPGPAHLTTIFTTATTTGPISTLARQFAIRHRHLNAKGHAMPRDRSFSAIVISLTVLLWVWIPGAFSAETKPPIGKIPRTIMSPPIPEVPADLKITEVLVWTTCSAGPGVTVEVKNEGPSIAFGTVVCVKPGANGLKQCRKAYHYKLKSGHSNGVEFLIEGGSPLMVTATTKNKKSDPDPSNNTCTINTAIPAPCQQPCRSGSCNYFRVNCH